MRQASLLRISKIVLMKRKMVILVLRQKNKRREIVRRRRELQFWKTLRMKRVKLTKKKKKQ